MKLIFFEKIFEVFEETVEKRFAKSLIGKIYCAHFENDFEKIFLKKCLWVFLGINFENGNFGKRGM